MRLNIISTLLPLATASTLLPTTEPAQQPQHIFSNPSNPSESSHRIPTSCESAILARRILALTPLGTLSTVFPLSSQLHETENRPSGLGGLPIGLTDYISDCEGNGNPTILAINIATSFKNAAAGSNISLSLQWIPPYPPSSRIGSFSLSSLPSLLSWLSFSSPNKPSEHKKGPLPFSAANLPRFSLLGYLEKIDSNIIHNLELAKCFVSTHPDAKFWLPGNPIHTSEWVRLVIQDIYWIGGFGDRAYIGWIPVEEWRNVTTEEWEEVRLPGEKKGWKEWSLGQEEL